MIPDRSQGLPCQGGALEVRFPHPPSEEVPLHVARTVIGLLGAIGAGKTYVGRTIAQVAGGQVLDADALARDVLEACARDGRLAASLGAGVLLASGAPDREAIARLVFADEAALRALERLIHPEVLTIFKDRIRRHRGGEGPGLLLLDVPLLLETGLDRHCDALWFVDTPDPLRLERVAERGIPAEEVRRREARQYPVARKRARADFVIDNTRELEPQIVAGLRALGLAAEARS